MVFPGSKADVFPQLQALLASKKCDNCDRLFGDHTPKEVDACLTKLGSVALFVGEKGG